MELDRRNFLIAGFAAMARASVPASTKASSDSSPEDEELSSNNIGCLVDTTFCMGCRQCEEACNSRNQLPRPEKPFSDRAVYRNPRRPSAGAFTVVNQFPGEPSPAQKKTEMTYCKTQCMHCLTPACVSACIVGAMTKTPQGAVVYNSTICLGCRYCMIACPFEIPAYEYSIALNPRVRKCQLCADSAGPEGAKPACAAVCPSEALVFGLRKDLLALAHRRIKERPNRYVDHIYGEKEASGTSWLYLTGRPRKELNLLDVPEKSPALITEAIQHGIFKYGLLPIGLYGTLGGIMRLKNRKNPEDTTTQEGGE